MVCASREKLYQRTKPTTIAMKLKTKPPSFLYGKTGFVVEVHQGGDDEEEDEDFVEVGNGNVSCVRAQEVAFVPAH